MKVDVKDLAMKNGIGKNVIGALRVLLDDNLKHVKITTGSVDTADTSQAKASLSGTIDLEMYIDDVTVRLDLDEITIQVW